MKARRLFSREYEDGGEGPPEGAPLGGTRTEAMQRLQVGLFGLTSMVLLVGLASIIGNQAELAEQAAVPDAAPTTEPVAPPPQRDPLADAGVVPPADPEPKPTAPPAEEGAPPAAMPTRSPPGRGGS